MGRLAQLAIRLRTLGVRPRRSLVVMEESRGLKSQISDKRATRARLSRSRSWVGSIRLAWGIG
jgi:hypothetical protein